MAHKGGDMNRPLHEQVRDVFTGYYSVLEEGVHTAGACCGDQKKLSSLRARIGAAADRFWGLSGFSRIKDRDGYFREIQAALRAEGYYLDITPQHGVDTGALDLATVDNISVRPIIQRNKRMVTAGGQKFEYAEFLLGENLITPPAFLPGIVESASVSEVAVFTEDLYRTLLQDHRLFGEYHEEAGRRYRKGVVSPDNLFCVLMQLHRKQWGDERPGAEAKGRLVEHFRLHGEQHVADFRLAEAGKLAFPPAGAGLTEELSRDMLLEARVMLRQMIARSLPFYTMGQVISFAREWMSGFRSEYAWAGYTLFQGFGEDGSEWFSRAEDMDSEDICRLAVRLAHRRPFFADLLTGQAEGPQRSPLSIQECSPDGP